MWELSQLNVKVNVNHKLVNKFRHLLRFVLFCTVLSSYKQSQSWAAVLPGVKHEVEEDTAQKFKPLENTFSGNE